MNVIILTEGGYDIGFGHITRSIALCQAFQEKGCLVKLIINGDESVRSNNDIKDYKIFNWIKEREMLLSEIDNCGVLIIDSYLADKELIREILPLADINVYMDDYSRIDYQSGVVVNGSILAEKLNYPQHKSMSFLLGCKYQPMRKSYWDVPDKIIKKKINNILIVIGWSDIRNIISTIIELIRSRYPKWEINIVSGKEAKIIKQIVKYKIDDKLHFHSNISADRMLHLMFKADIAISGGGQTLYELVRVGVPSIAIVVSNNQINNIKGLESIGIINYAGYWDDEKLNLNIKKNIDKLLDQDKREKLKRIGKNYYDGQGARNIVSYILDMK